MKNLVALEQGRVLMEALRIVDKLADNDFADVDGSITDDQSESLDNLKTLIIRARSLKNDRWWDSMTKNYVESIS
jgi:hypothetical protein